MASKDRAKIFSSFNPLSTLERALRQKEREKCEKLELDESKVDEILKNIVLLARNRGVKYLACEMGYDQKQSLSAFLREQGFRTEFYKDLAQFDRGFVARNLNRS